ncbi:hypothetical protein A9179_12265 [Pseudomonas alcaligenes]|uniref:Uncharacterized protein n=1 Tax=Aquipseudomonas alcaligenes TaxID=43263 RepID=A0ABR7S0E8_AQUAC|nr:hypothetical protein [Pseudomonas alcaligenes]MBC9251050.1 hypothetical protein [Pseudomonas alcaligenes]
MSDDTQSDTELVVAEDIGDDSQRIARLEKAGKLNRLLIYALAGALGLVLLAWLLIALLTPKHEEKTEKPEASEANSQALEKEIGALQLQVDNLQKQLQDQQKLILLQQKTALAPAPTPAAAAATPQPSNRDRETQQMVARILLGQERSYQASIAALKMGMRDLAGMIAGSRSWLEDYEADLNKPLAESQARAKALQQWLDGKPASP